LVVVALSSAASAADSKKNLSEWSCVDFLTIQETDRPVAVGVAEALTRKNKIEDEAVDVDYIQKLTPMVVQYCTENPKAKVKEAVKKSSK